MNAPPAPDFAADAVSRDQETLGKAIEQARGPEIRKSR